MKGKMAILVAVTGTFSAVPVAAWERISTEDQFRATIADRTLTTTTGNTFSYQGDGRIVGTWSGQPMAGRWEWHQGFFCRNVRLGNGPETGTDCQLLELRGNEVRTTRDQGRGEVVGVATIN
ncbi:MAG: hypothetical protein ACXIUV_13115 [Alkalilacustris sp.]